LNQEPSIHEVIKVWQGLDQDLALLQANSVFRDIIDRLSSVDELFLPTDFSQLAYFIQKYKIDSRARFGLHQLRLQLKSYDSSRAEYGPSENQLYELCHMVFQWLSEFCSNPITPYFPIEEVPDVFRSQEPKKANRIPSARILIIGKNEEHQFVGVAEALNEDVILILPGITIFNGEDLTAFLGTVIPFPFFVNVFDVETESGLWKVDHFSLLPDYLVDVTAIAGGFQSHEFSIWPYFIQKVLPKRTSIHMFIGNVVNHVLDQIITEPSINLDAIYQNIFRLFALDVIALDDDEVYKLINTVSKHFKNLLRAVEQDFEKLNIYRNNCELEPSFLSSEYGLQGRLDVLSKGEEVTIVELKSGKPFRPNSYGIKTDHYVQTLLYDLLLRSADVSQNPRNFILYSSQEKQPLRYAPAVKKIQIDALTARNQIIILDAFIRSPDPEVFVRPFDILLRSKIDGISTFTERDRDEIKKVFDAASQHEIIYYQYFLSFVMRELQISKIGESGIQGRPGLSAVWLNSIKEKEQEFNILKNMTVRAVIPEQGDLFIEFNFSNDTDPLANFRKGDVALIYPNNKGDQSAIRNQIHKCTIVRRDDNSVLIRLRSKQLDTSVFDVHPYWNLEKDVLDSGFNSSYDSLFLFLGGPDKKKRLFLGMDKPGNATLDWPSNYTFTTSLLPTQVSIVKDMFCAQDYFLLWGPPGTGKTSVMIRELIKVISETSDEDVYLLAYTNKAVDELCKAVKSLPDAISKNAVRLGSRFSCNPDHTDMLFDRQIKDLKDRRSLKTFISQKRIVISTLASFWGKRRLIKEVGKGILIVDEASQILEPSIVGLLAYFSKFILVGDHLQLPAVSVQPDKTSVVTNQDLLELGISNLKMSFFERMYRWHIKNGWTDNLALLQHQGRMHVDIMNFVNRVFYKDALEVIPGLERLIESPQTGSLIEKYSRMVYISSQAYPNSPMIKSNADEANKAIQVIELWLKSSGTTLSEIEMDEIGIITPFRAQIALIRHQLYERFGVISEKISVDTVERYQGGARSVVIVSMCLNRESQLNSVVSLSEDGVDRKFNVALTRAREQIFVIGNPEIMKKVDSYSAFMDIATAFDLSD
jgi:DNA replication ATP-dependent helicase Dna2